MKNFHFVIENIKPSKPDGNKYLDFYFYSDCDQIFDRRIEFYFEQFYLFEVLILNTIVFFSLNTIFSKSMCFMSQSVQYQKKKYKG